MTIVTVTFMLTFWDKYNLKEGIVIDTRNNGGGRLHEDIEILFSGNKYLDQVVRGVVACEMPLASLQQAFHHDCLRS